MADESSIGSAVGLDAKARQTIVRANLANIIKKVHAGKPLTRAEIDVVAGRPSVQERKAEREAVRVRDGSHTRERAEYWGCKLRTMQIMLKEGTPVDSDAGMIEWYCRLPGRSQQMLSAPFRARIDAVRAKLEGRGDGTPAGTAQGGVAPDPDVADFLATYRPGIGEDRDNLADIRRERAYYLFKMQRARLRRDRATESEAARQFRNFSDVLHDAELRAKKLGRELGENYSAEDLRRVGRATGFWLMRGADDLIGQLATALASAAATGPLDREKIRATIDPLITAARVVAPIQRATEVKAGIALPKVFVEAFKAGLAEVVEETETQNP